MKLTESRIDASLLTEEERRLLGPLLDLAEKNKRPSLKGSDGAEVQLPAAIFRILIKVIQNMREGKSVALIPEEKTFTTQAAANYLGMSRQYFVTLLESGKIPFHRVGSHRRVYFKDLRDFAKKRDEGRRAGLKQLFQRLDRKGHYDTEYMGEDGR
jgi:excisionase family DNA binding protein